MKNQARAKEMFPVKGGFVSLLAESKSDNLITLAAFKEFKELQDQSVAATVENEGKNITFPDICIKVMGNCIMGENPTLFASKRDGTVDFDQFADDAALLEAVKSGKGSSY